MKSFNKELKDELVAEIVKHREHDQIVQGTYGTRLGGEFKGCAVGCAIHSLNILKGRDLCVSDHRVYEIEFGIPTVLARLEDVIFEGLSVEDSKLWPETFMSAVPEETDLSLIWPKFAVWLLTDKEHGAIKYAEDKETIQKASDLYSELIGGRSVTLGQWQKEKYADATYATATYAADATYAAATYAADATYAAATYAAANDAAANDAAANDAKRKCFKAMADKLVNILKTETTTVQI